MKTEALLRDPVFHLNILLWMSKEQPSMGYRVRPLRHDLGFRIIYIEQPFAFPDDTMVAIGESALDISAAPEPELILGRVSDGRALYFEAKADSFGPESTSNAKQARGHLLANGPAFGEVLEPLTSSLLCYVVPDRARGPMSDCLSALSAELTEAGLRPGPFSSHGLSLSEGGLSYVCDPAFRSHAGALDERVSIIEEISEETDPAPLLLVFSDEDCPNGAIRDFYRRVVTDQVRACLLCDLHAHPVGADYETTPDDLLERTTDGLFQYLGRQRQKGLRRLVRENVLKRIQDYWLKKQSGIQLADDRLRIKWSVIGEKDDFLNWLEDRRTRFGTGKPLEQTPSLFDGHE